jgi:hypothetical protein
MFYRLKMKRRAVHYFSLLSPFMHPFLGDKQLYIDISEFDRMSL